MRKLLTVLLAALLLCGMLAGCATKECDICGKEGAGKEEVAGQEVYLCDDCAENIDKLGGALGDLAGSLGDALGDLSDKLGDLSDSLG